MLRQIVIIIGQTLKRTKQSRCVFRSVFFFVSALRTITVSSVSQRGGARMRARQSISLEKLLTCDQTRAAELDRDRDYNVVGVVAVRCV